jgi:hypothetical protein
MRLFHPTFYLLIFLASISAFASDVESIIEGVKHNDSLIKSGKGNLIVRLKYAEEGREIRGTGPNIVLQDKAYHIFYAFNEAGEIRCDLGSEGKPLIRIYDGKKVIQFVHERKILENGEVDEFWTGRIYQNPRIIHSFLDPLYWGIKYDNKRAGQVLAKQSPRSVGRELIDKEMCEMIEIDPPSTVFEGTYRFWIAPGQGYRILKQDISMPGQSRRIIFHTRYKKLPGDIWLPWYSHYINYLLDKEGNETALSKWSMEMKDYVVNTDLDEELFQFDTSKVREVFDERIGRILTQQEIDTLFD